MPQATATCNNWSPLCIQLQVQNREENISSEKFSPKNGTFLTYNHGKRDQQWHIHIHFPDHRLQ